MSEGEREYDGGYFAEIILLRGRFLSYRNKAFLSGEWKQSRESASTGCSRVVSRGEGGGGVGEAAEKDI